MPEFQKNSHCSYCGTAFAANTLWPRRCAHCGNVTYSNPLPVSVVLLPLDGGLLLVRRTQEPQAGRWALPGGFIETGETWQEAGAREMREETGYTIDPVGIRLFDTRSAPDGTLLVFGLAQALSSNTLPKFTPSSETSEAMIAPGPRELAFLTHTETADRYWKEIIWKEIAPDE
jgi:ADP-ribose pyrophosphatase YjhB (NUDIX family)